MDLLQRFKQVISASQLFGQEDVLILAVSGGVDSVVLCELCHQAGYRFSIAHCNFRLRGEESERDEKFVKGLGDTYGVAVQVKSFDTEEYAGKKRLSIQEAARELRYVWFEELVNSEWSIVNSQTHGSSIHHSPLTIHLLTAHHADDNIETLLMHFFRGTGLKGLTGIPAKAGYIRRPLLSFFKNELLDFAREHKLGFVEDSSNLSSRYTRNYFRNEWIPAAEKVFPQVRENLLDNIGRFTEIEKLYQLTVNGLKKKLLKQKGKEWHIPFRQLLGYRNRALVYEIIADFGFTEKQVDELIRLGQSESGRYIASPGGPWRIIKHRNWFIISEAAPDAAGILVIDEGQKTMLFENGELQLEKSRNLQPSANPLEACLDAKQVRFPLLLRKWKTGDYFYPLGMKKKKKISRFFIDQKLSKTEKEQAWVLESDQRIIWVAGRRIDDRFKVTASTEQVLRLRLIPSQ